MTQEQLNTLTNLVDDYYENHDDPGIPVMDIMYDEQDNELIALELPAISDTALIDTDGTFVYVNTEGDTSEV